MDTRLRGLVMAATNIVWAFLVGLVVVVGVATEYWIGRK